MSSKPVEDARAELGLPSSSIKNTIEPKARAFLESLDLISLVRLIMFWITRDGSIHMEPISGNRLSFGGLRLAARDNRILYLLQEALEKHQLRNCCTVTASPSGFFLTFMRSHQGLRTAIKNALAPVPMSVLHPKLKLLQRFLSNPKGHIPRQCLTPTLNFHDYLQNHLNDGLLCVLGQIEDFDLREFKKKALKLEANQLPKSDKQSLFLQYITHCRQRVLQNADPKNVSSKYLQKIRL
ncbi:hypothetical protein MBANPS3_005406 [Mucor bainieri]